MIFKKIALLLLVIVSTITQASHVDLGYKDSFEFSALVNGSKNFYLKASSNNESSYYGAGIGVNHNNYEYVLTVNTDGYEQSFDFDVSYYDVGPSYFFSIKRNSADKGFKIGVGSGYPINEKVSFIVKYEDGFFFGVRRWI